MIIFVLDVLLCSYPVVVFAYQEHMALKRVFARLFCSFGIYGEPTVTLCVLDVLCIYHVVVFAYEHNLQDGIYG